MTAASQSRFEKVELNHPVYKPETCRAKPLVGFVLGLLEMPPKVTRDNPEGRAWFTYVIRTTEDTLAVPMGEESASPVKAGAEVLCPVNQSLRKLAPLARDENLMYEVEIKPTKKVPVKGTNKTMWLFDAGVNPTPVKRTGLALAMAKASPQLTSGGAADADAGGDEIPF